MDENKKWVSKIKMEINSTSKESRHKNLILIVWNKEWNEELLAKQS